MSKHKLFGGDFSPYDALMELNERVVALEKAHNKLAIEFHRTSTEFNILLEEFHNLQNSHLNLAKLVGITSIGKYTSNK